MRSIDYDLQLKEYLYIGIIICFILFLSLFISNIYILTAILFLSFLFLIIVFPKIIFDIFLSFFCIINPYLNAGFILMFLALICLKNILSRKKIVLSKDTGYFYISYMLILIANFFSMFSSVNPIDSFIDIFTWITFILILICILCIYNLSELSKLIKILSNSSIVLVMCLIIQKYFNSIYEIILSIPVIRVPGTNYLAMMLIIIMPLLIYEYSECTRLKSKITNIIRQAIILFGIYLTDSRGIIVLVIFMYSLRVIGLVMREKNRLKRLIKVAVIILILFFIGLFLGDRFYRLVESVKSIFDANNYSNNIRLILYRDALFDMFPNNPIIGIGVKNFIYVFPKYDSINFNPFHAHSIYLQTLLEQGIIGALCLANFFIVMFIHFINGIKNSVNKFFYLACMESVSYFMIYSVVENTWGDSRMGLFLFSIIGISYIKNKKIKFDSGTAQI